MNIHLTEEIIRQRASAQSYQKGYDYYRGWAIFNSSWQSIPGGVALTAYCEGSRASSYRLQVELDSGGIWTAFCTCLYDRGGDCKHIVALLLTYLHRPEEFSEQKSPAELLAGLEKDDLLALITILVQKNPDLYDELERAIPVVQAAVRPKVASRPQEKRQTQVLN